MAKVPGNFHLTSAGKSIPIEQVELRHTINSLFFTDSPSGKGRDSHTQCISSNQPTLVALPPGTFYHFGSRHQQDIEGTLRHAHHEYESEILRRAHCYLTISSS